MLNADCAPYFNTCPRCGTGGYETLKTHSYCVDCNYTNMDYLSEESTIPDWVIEFLKSAKPKSLLKELNLDELSAVPNAI